MNDEQLKKYLRDNSAPVPPEALGEATRIWLRIDGKKHGFSLWWSLIPAIATAALLVFVIRSQTGQYESRIEEAYLYQEWNAMMSDVNSEEGELITTLEK